MTAARIDHLVTSGEFRLDGETHQVDNNVWIVGDDTEAVVIDAAHTTPTPSRRRWGSGRCARAIVCTHAHNDHIDAAPPPSRNARAHRSCCTRTTCRCGR